MSILNKFLREIKQQFDGLTDSSGGFSSRLHQKVTDLLPDKDEETLLKVACVSGLLARVAFVDLHIDDSEKKVIIDSLIKWSDLSDDEAKAVAELCLEEIKDLAGVENHLYCLPLREALSEKERFNIIKALFAVAAADGNVDNGESEEIRNINHGLYLEHQHYISARSTILEHLGALKKD